MTVGSPRLALPQALWLLVCGMLAIAACSKDGSPKYSGPPDPVAATYGQCSFCHQGLAGHMYDTGGHGSLEIKCESCHPDLTPNAVGPAHRAIPACADCHSRAETHQDPLAGTRGECTVCHTPHGSSNLRLVRQEVAIPNEELRPITFTNRMGLADGSYASASQPGTGICEVCHSDTTVYRSDGAGAPHFTFTCVSCHTHAAAFAPPPSATPTNTSAPSATPAFTATVTSSPTLAATVTATTTPTGPSPTPTSTPTGPSPTPTSTGTSTAIPTPPVLLAPRVETPPAGIDDPLWDQAPPLVPGLTNMSTGLLPGDGLLNMSGTFDGLDDFNDGAPAELTLRALHDGGTLYILATWNDMTFNLDQRRWLFNGPTDPLKPGESAAGWTSQRNDDKIAFAFEIDAASSEFGAFATAGCAASCHNVDDIGLQMQPASGRVDLWDWQTSGSEPLGHVTDQVADGTTGRRDDSGTPIKNRNIVAAGDNRSGPLIEWDGTPQTFTRWDGSVVTLDPAYLVLDGHQMPFAGDAAAGEALYASACAVCHGTVGQGGIGPALNRPEETRKTRVELDALTAAPGHPGASSYNAYSAAQKTDVLARLRGFSGIPGYFLTAPSGSIADIVTQSNVDLTRVGPAALERVDYEVLIIRPLDTGFDDDVQFVPGNDYPFGVALMDDDDRNHIGTRYEILRIEP